jgi:hypothetical protein
MLDGSPIYFDKRTIITPSRTPIPAGAPGAMKPANHDKVKVVKITDIGGLDSELPTSPTTPHKIRLATRKKSRYNNQIGINPFR